jgi:alkylation response protein AidB-like acyl-CoA dehydrogenase
VDFELSPDQRALRDAAADLLAGRSPMPVVRGAVDRGGEPDRDLWKAMVDQGWCGLAVPEKLGGVGLGWVEAAIVLEQVGAHVAPAPVLGQMVALEALADGAWGPRLIAGEAVAACAERLDQPCVYAPAADVVVVPEDDRLMAVELGERRPAAEPAMDVTRQLGWLESAALADAPRTEIGGAAAVARHLDVAAVAYAAELLGVAQRALDLAVAYAKDRVQFGRPIGSFQAVKHRLADCYIALERARALCYFAVACLAEDDPRRHDASAMAKAAAGDGQRFVAAEGIQLLGGIAYTWEHDQHLWVKRAITGGLLFGQAAEHRADLVFD